MGGRWKKVRAYLALSLCGLSSGPQDDENRPIEREEMYLRSSSTTLDSVPSLRVSTPAPVSPQASTLNETPPASGLPRSACSICLETMKAGNGLALFTAECSHTFHFSCIASNVRHGSLICPVCRSKWREVPWEAPLEGSNIGGGRDRMGSRSGRLFSSFHSRSRSHSRSSSQGGEDTARRLDPLLRNLDEGLPNSAPTHWFDFPPELIAIYNDDDPLEHTTKNISGDAESLSHPQEELPACESRYGKRAAGQTPSCSYLEVSTYPEVSPLAASEACESFTILVHLKAPPASHSEMRRNDTEERAGCSSSSSTQIPEPICRASLDLVTVLDVSGSMAGTKIALLKRAMRFVIHHLGPNDRLSVVAFSSSARRILPLRRMVGDGKKQALQAIDALVSSGGTNIADGLRKGTKVLEDRRNRNPVSSIMLLSDGQDTYAMGSGRQFLFSTQSRGLDNRTMVQGSASRYGNMSVPVHSFGFGEDHDSVILHAVSEASGGTFSFIQAEGAVQDAFAQCIGGLLSVVVQDVQLMLSCCTPGVIINNIQSGSYENTIVDSGNHGTIKLGDLYAEEERDILVDLKLPALHNEVSECSDIYSMLVLRIGYECRDPVTQGVMSGPTTCEMRISRPPSVLKEERVVSLEVDRQQNRLRSARVISEARSLADRGELACAQQILQSAKTTLQSSLSAQVGDQLSNVLEAELAEIQVRIANMQSYERSGRAYLLSAQSSHFRQRATTRGESVDGCSMDYQTPSMVDMVMRSQKLTAFPFPSHKPS